MTPGNSVAEQAEVPSNIETDVSKRVSEQAAEHQAAWTEPEVTQARRRSDSNQFKFVVRGGKGDSASGSVPRDFFQPEPDSALARMYGGEWTFATDEEGRALVNSNPTQWPMILDWLSFGA